MRAHIFKTRYRNEPGDAAFCRQAVSDRAGWHFYQCQRKPTVIRCVDGVEYGFCKQHDPEAVARRAAERHAKWDAKWDARTAEEMRAAQEKRALEACKAALKQIAAGHNDPRALAAEVLALFPAPLSPSPSTVEAGR